MIEEKDTEISRLLDDNKNLRQSLESKPPVCLLSTPFGYNFLMYFVLSVFCTHYWPLSSIIISQADQIDNIAGRKTFLFPYSSAAHIQSELNELGH